MQKLILPTLTALFLLQAPLYSHCQLPCGVYHDEMVFEQIDQYIETMYKGITVINDSKFSTVADRNETIRWVLLKDKYSDETANLITTYFLQQKIKPGEADTDKKVLSAHKLLFLLVKIKQNVDRNIVLEFSKEWDTFKSFFHRQGYQCEMEKQRLQKEAHDHDHDHDDHHAEETKKPS